MGAGVGLWIGGVWGYENRDVGVLGVGGRVGAGNGGGASDDQGASAGDAVGQASRTHARRSAGHGRA